MANLTISGLLFYGGIFTMGAAAILAVAAIIIFRVSGKRLNSQLETEFGERRR